MTLKDFYDMWSDFLGKGYETKEITNEVGYVIERYIVGEELICETDTSQTYPTGEPIVRVVERIPIKLREIYSYYPILQDGFIPVVPAFVIDHSQTRRIIEKNGKIIFDQIGGEIE